ncbi:hypothetical protein CPC08DRAFT_770349 [Agrocybe pediades]|nr:hypothetical protein CPC08DRAFT_770349 [Agrocybe pediades]
MSAQLSFEEQLTQAICQHILDLLNGDTSDEEEEEINPFGVESRSNEEDNSSNGVQVEEASFAMPRKRARGNNTDPATARRCSSMVSLARHDNILHLPRSVFSRKLLDLLLWLLRVNKVDDVPSVSRMTTLSKVLHRGVGVQTREYNWKIGSKYYVKRCGSNLSAGAVLKSLSFYPEDDGQNNLREARQFSRWHEFIPEETTPMIRLGTDDYCIFEPTLLRDGRFCVPFRWFTRVDPGTRGHVFYCKAWAMEAGNHDGEDGWLVHEDREFEVCESELP